MSKRDEIKLLKQNIRSIEAEIYFININEKYMKNLYIQSNSSNYSDFRYKYVDNLNNKIIDLKRQINEVR